MYVDENWITGQVIFSEYSRNYKHVYSPEGRGCRLKNDSLQAVLYLYIGLEEGLVDKGRRTNVNADLPRLQCFTACSKSLLLKESGQSSKHAKYAITENSTYD